MARCGCSSDNCACTIIAGENVVVSGTGSRENPYIVDAILPAPVGGGGEAPRLSGEIIMFAGANVPAGWVLCDGREVSRAVYPDLYSAIGTLYGAGDGATTFNVPNLAAKFPRGSSESLTLGSQGGAVTTSFTIGASNLPRHSHSIDHDHGGFASGGGGTHAHSSLHVGGTGGAQVGWRSDIYAGGGLAGIHSANYSPMYTNSTGDHQHWIDVPYYSGGSGNAYGNASGNADPMSVSTVPPYVALNFIIKA